MRGYFVTGTDTEIGKTVTTLALLAGASRQGVEAVGFKPVASGCERDASGQLVNEDALAIQAEAPVRLAYDKVNPYSFEPPIAPHVAAAEAGVDIDLSALARHIGETAGERLAIVEGVGGWAVPLGPDSSVADLAGALGLPVILVVGMRLGCLNHALLTAESIQASGLVLAGWVANCPGAEMARLEENLVSLKHRLSATFLGCIPPLDLPAGEAAASHLDLTQLPGFCVS
jgi:dethiobiotin synthetase